MITRRRRFKVEQNLKSEDFFSTITNKKPDTCLKEFFDIKQQNQKVRITGSR